MKMQTIVCVAAALVLGTSLPTAAQQGGGSATRSVERLAERSPVREILRDAAALGLTREQVGALEALDRELAARADSAVAALRVAEARSGTGGYAGADDGPGRRLRESRGVLLRAQGEAAERARAILTPEQREAYQRLAADRNRSSASGQS